MAQIIWDKYMKQTILLLKLIFLIVNTPFVDDRYPFCFFAHKKCLQLIADMIL